MLIFSLLLSWISLFITMQALRKEEEIDLARLSEEVQPRRIYITPARYKALVGIGGLIIVIYNQLLGELWAVIYTLQTLLG